MTKLDRALVAALAVAMVGVAVSGLAPRWRGPAGVVRAADCHDNAQLDVVRRGLQFAQDTARAERERAADLARNRLSLGELRGEIDHAFSLFKSERDRYTQLVKSSAMGDKQLAQDALQRSADWLKVETTLRTMYVGEIERLLRQAADDREQSKAAMKSSGAWERTAEALRGAFGEEVKRVTSAPAAAKAK